MAAKDLFHPHVRRALEKDGWTITDDPLSLRWLGTTLQVDLGAERVIAATRGAELIAVEIKSFIGASAMTDLENALGQFLLYRAALKKLAPQRKLFLAIRDDVYDAIFAQPEGEFVREDGDIHLLVFNADREEVVKWIS
jgi:methyl coenzyme M reductase beta subunit